MKNMLFDVWVNWSYGGDTLNYIPEFFEWRKDDEIQLLDRVPVVRVSKELYKYIEQDYGELPQELLDKVQDQCYIMRNKKTFKLNWGMVVTDGKNVLAVSTEETKEPFYKSRIKFNNEEAAREQAAMMRVLEYDFEIPKKVEKKAGKSTLSDFSTIKPEYMIGITRTERELKAILFDIFFDLACSKDVHKIRYWYLEVFPTEFEQSQTMTKNKMLKQMFEEIKFGWSPKHFEFGNKLVDSSGVFKELWSDIVARRDNKKDTDKKKIKKKEENWDE